MKILLTLVLLGHLPALIVLLLGATDWAGAAVAAVARQERLPAFASTAAAFAFTLLGFLTAVLSLFVSLGQTRALKLYRQHGYLWLLHSLLALAMVELTLTFAAAMSLFFGEPGAFRIMLTVCLAGGATGLCVMTVFPLLSLHSRS